MNTLTEKQKAYYNERVQFFKSMGVAAPTGLIHKKASKMTDKQCDEWLKQTAPLHSASN